MRRKPQREQPAGARLYLGKTELTFELQTENSRKAQ